MTFYAGRHGVYRRIRNEVISGLGNQELICIIEGAWEIPGEIQRTTTNRRDPQDLPEKVAGAIQGDNFILLEPLHVGNSKSLPNAP